MTDQMHDKLRLPGKITARPVILFALVVFLAGATAAAAGGTGITTFVRNQPFNGTTLRQGDQFFLELKPLLRSLELGASVQGDNLVIAPGQRINLPPAAQMPSTFTCKGRSDTLSHFVSGEAYLVDIYDFTQLLGLTYKFNNLSRILDIYAPPNPVPAVSGSTPGSQSFTLSGASTTQAAGATTQSGAGGTTQAAGQANPPAPDTGPTNYESLFTFRNVTVAYDYVYNYSNYFYSPWGGGFGPFTDSYYGSRQSTGGHLTGKLFNDYHRTAVDIQVLGSTSDGSTMFTIPISPPGDDMPFNSPTFNTNWTGPQDPVIKLKILNLRWQ